MEIREMGFNYKGYYCYLFTNSNGNYNVNIFETDDKVQAIHTLIEEDAETTQNKAKEYIDELEKNERRYHPDLAYQIQKLEQAVKNFKKSREQDIVKREDIWNLQENQAELLLELAKQHNKEG